MLFELMTRQEPYGGTHGECRSIGEESDALFQEVVTKDLRPVFPPKGVIEGVRSIAIDCWHRNPARRPTFAEVDGVLQTAFQVRSHPRPL